MSERRSLPETRRSLPKWLGTAWGKVVAVGGALATIVGIVAIVLSVTEAVGRNDTTVGSVSVDSEVVDEAPAPRSGVAAVEGVGLEYYKVSGDYTSWAVPVDAPFGELLAATGGEYAGNGCTVEQVAWLERYGVSLPNQRLRVALRNTATSGSSLVVSNIRAEGELSEPAVEVVDVSCSEPIRGEPIPQYAELAIGTGEVAVFSEIEEYMRDWYVGTGEAGEPGTPVVFDIAPGEAASLELHYEHALDFHGRFVATVTVDGVESTLVLTPNGEDIFAPIVTVNGVSVEIVGTELECQGWGTTVPGEQPVCDLAHWESALAEAIAASR